MRWTYTLGRVGETEIKLHLTFFLLLAYWAAGGYQAGGMSGTIGAVAMLIALFVCVLLHEFGHITMARRFGVRTPDVLILPIGGVARLERIPDEPRQELLIALAGALAGLLSAAPATGQEVPCLQSDVDADMWFAESPSVLEEAKSLCADCPIWAECLDGALSRGEPWGVWGGEIFERGRVIPRKRPRGRPRKADLERDRAWALAAGA